MRRFWAFFVAVVGLMFTQIAWADSVPETIGYYGYAIGTLNTTAYENRDDGDHKVYGPYYATQIEAITAGDHLISSNSDTDVSISFNYYSSTNASIMADGEIIESDHSTTSVEYIRSSSDLWSEKLSHLTSPVSDRYYIHVQRHSGPSNEFVPIIIRYR